jgi:hypothetical protein
VDRPHYNSNDQLVATFSFLVIKLFISFFVEQSVFTVAPCLLIVFLARYFLVLEDKTHNFLCVTTGSSDYNKIIVISLTKKKSG